MVVRAVVLGSSLALVVAATRVAPAQGASTPAASAQSPNVRLTAQQQIASAVLPLPQELRDGAEVLGYGADGRLVTLRAASHGNGMICLASDPRREQFHVACYHRSMEPFMARGRALRASGVTGDEVDSVRFREARTGKLRLPTKPAALYTLTGEKGSYDPATNTIARARPLYVVYIPYATAASTGLSAVPVQDAPWIMFPGTPKAHIMFVARMQ